PPRFVNSSGINISVAPNEDLVFIVSLRTHSTNFTECEIAREPYSTTKKDCLSQDNIGAPEAIELRPLSVRSEGNHLYEEVRGGGQDATVQSRNRQSPRIDSDGYCVPAPALVGSRSEGSRDRQDPSASSGYMDMSQGGYVDMTEGRKAARQRHPNERNALEAHDEMIELRPLSGTSRSKHLYEEVKDMFGDAAALPAPNRQSPRVGSDGHLVPVPSTSVNVHSNDRQDSAVSSGYYDMSGYIDMRRDENVHTAKSPLYENTT
ncbi:hypothetical protein BaRGS_00039585, partial [Batillaria attramentaria]